MNTGDGKDQISKQIKLAIEKESTLHLFLYIFFLGMFPVFIFFIFQFPADRYSPIQMVIRYFMLFCWGLSAIPIIVRKELPGLIHFKGWGAVLSGILLIIISWGLILIDLISVINEINK